MNKLKIYDIDENKKLGFEDVLSHDSSFVKFILYLHSMETFLPYRLS